MITPRVGPEEQASGTGRWQGWAPPTGTVRQWVPGRFVVVRSSCPTTVQPWRNST